MRSPLTRDSPSPDSRPDSIGISKTAAEGGGAETSTRPGQPARETVINPSSRGAKPSVASAAWRDVAIHKALISFPLPGLLAALVLRASLRLFNALCALVPRFARNDRTFFQRFPTSATRRHRGRSPSLPTAQPPSPENSATPRGRNRACCHDRSTRSRRSPVTRRRYCHGRYR